MGWQLHLGSCLDPLTGLASLADKSVDVSIDDPPYDDHTHKAGRRGATGMREPTRPAAQRAQFNRNRNLGFAAITPEEMAESARQRARVTRRWVITFCAVEMVGDSAKDGGKGWRAHLERAGLEYVRTAVWHKLGCTPQFTGDRPAQAVEAIVIAHAPGRKRWNGGGKHGYYAHPIVLDRAHNGGRLHTTQKPLSLMRELIEDFTDPGELVLDSYAGSGTTGLAAIQLGRRFIGWERAACARCSVTAEWHCSWLDGEKPQSAYLCDAHRDEVSVRPSFTAYRDNYHAIASRRLNGDEAKPRPEQPSLFGGAL